jgi:hypothetical protein
MQYKTFVYFANKNKNKIYTNLMDGETANELQRKSSDTHHVDTGNKKYHRVYY